MNKNLPAKFKPTKAVEDVDVPATLDKAVVAVPDNELNELLVRQGLGRITAQNIRDMATLGIYVSGAGITRTQKGACFATMSRLDFFVDAMVGQAQAELGKKKPSASKIQSLGRTAAYIASKHTEAQKLLLEMNGGRAVIPTQGEDVLPENQAFGLGEIITASTTVNHIHAENVQINGSVPTEKVIAKEDSTP